MLVDFFLLPRRPIIFLQVLSLFIFGLDPPKSLDGGVVGGVIGESVGLGRLPESSVNIMSGLAVAALGPRELLAVVEYRRESPS